MRLLKDAVGFAIDRRRRLVYGATRACLRRLPGDGARRLEYEWLMVPKAEYACGLSQACRRARELGASGFTAIEFGVGGGDGLKVMERHASWLSTDTGLRIDVVGFDRGSGLAPPVDHRDLGYRWREGDFRMDEAALRQQLRGAELIIGDIDDTIRSYEPGLPIGFISFDRDFYSSTMSAFQVVEGDDWNRWLPRISAYFDDLRVIEWAGERQAISDWNEKQSDRRIGQILGVRDMLFASPPWGDKMFEIHLFRHPQYNDPVSD